MLLYNTLPMKNARALIGQIVLLQNFWDKKFYADALTTLAEKGADITTLMDGHRLIGCMTVVPATLYPCPLKHRKTLEKIAKAPLENFVVRSTVHVKDGFKGKGYGTEIDRVGREHALEKQFTHAVEFGFATKEIESWFRSRPNAIETGLIDHMGCGLIIEPL